MDRATYTATACITGAEALTSATGHATAVSSSVERSLDKRGVAGAAPAPRTMYLKIRQGSRDGKAPKPRPSALRWRSTDVSMNAPCEGGALVSGVVSKTALGGFDPHATCNVTPMNTQHRQQRERQQRLQRQSGAVTARFTASTLSV